MILTIFGSIISHVITNSFLCSIQQKYNGHKIINSIGLVMENYIFISYTLQLTTVTDVTDFD